MFEVADGHRSETRARRHLGADLHLGWLEPPASRGPAVLERTWRQPRGPVGERAEQSVEDASEHAGAESRRERLPPPCHRVAHPQSAGVLERFSGERTVVDRDHLGGDPPVADLHDVEGGHAGQTLDLH